MSYRCALLTQAFLLNHSTAYQAAAVFSWAEYGLRAAFAPTLPIPPIVGQIGSCLDSFLTVGLVGVILGDFLRKLAMFTARSNFSHQIVTEREREHRLVTNGVYRLCRHPSYLGWFVWSVSTQLLLGNPISLVSLNV